MDAPKNLDKPEYEVGELVRVLVDGPYKDAIGEVIDVTSTRDAFVYTVSFKRTIEDTCEHFISTEIELYKRLKFRPGETVQVKNGPLKGGFVKILGRVPGFGLYDNMLDFKYRVKGIGLVEQEYIECEGNLSKLFYSIAEDLERLNLSENKIKSDDLVTNSKETQPRLLKFSLNLSEEYINIASRVAVTIIKELKLEPSYEDISKVSGKIAAEIIETIANKYSPKS